MIYHESSHKLRYQIRDRLSLNGRAGGGITQAWYVSKFALLIYRSDPSYLTTSCTSNNQHWSKTLMEKSHASQQIVLDDKCKQELKLHHDEQSSSISQQSFILHVDPCINKNDKGRERVQVRRIAEVQREISTRRIRTFGEFRGGEGEMLIT